MQKIRKRTVPENDIDPRSVLIVSAFLMGIDGIGVNHLLTAHGFCRLYLKRCSDVIWKYILQNHLQIAEAEKVLEKYGQCEFFSEKTILLGQLAMIKASKPNSRTEYRRSSLSAF